MDLGAGDPGRPLGAGAPARSRPRLPAGRGNVELWTAGLRGLPGAGSGAPWILAGDFNATLDQPEFRELVDRGYRDAGAVAGRGLVPTWPSNRRFPPLIAIDHVLADRRLDMVAYSVEELPGSDHRQAFATLALD